METQTACRITQENLEVLKEMQQGIARLESQNAQLRKSLVEANLAVFVLEAEENQTDTRLRKKHARGRKK